ncbi:MAG: hypothetical protein R3B72_36770 [Polyangiaceae bacterium]
MQARLEPEAVAAAQAAVDAVRELQAGGWERDDAFGRNAEAWIRRELGFA